MMGRTIFYSWQNDLDHRSHRYFIEKCLRQALKAIKNEAHIVADYDRDTKGLAGSPDITSTIFQKIEKSVLFICDISIISRPTDQKKTPNPNVLLELGYAVHKLGWERVICLFDSNSGNISDLPFDLRQKRITIFNPEKDDEANRITKIFTANIQSLFAHEQMFTPLNDYMKGRIDHPMLRITEQMANLVFGTITMSEGLSKVKDLLNLSEAKLNQALSEVQFPAFIALNTFADEKNNLQTILSELLSSSHFPKEWLNTVSELIFWINDYNHVISERNRHYPFMIVDNKEYTNLDIISGQSINNNNTSNSFLIIETIKKDDSLYAGSSFGKVINCTQYPTNDALSLRKCLAIKADSIKAVLATIQKIIMICNSWLDITDEEFILAPEYYFIQ